VLAVKTSLQLHVPKLSFRAIRKPDGVLIERVTTCTARVNAYNTASLSGKSTEDHRANANPITHIETGMDPLHRHLHKLDRLCRLEAIGENLRFEKKSV